MTSNKLILLFNSLSEQELRDLKLFVRSPFFNQRKDVVQLFDVLRKENLGKLTEEKLYKKVFPKKDFDKKEMAYVMNYLIKVVEKYFAFQASNRSEAHREFRIATTALEHGQENFFQQKIKKARQFLEKNELDDLEKRHLQFKIEMELYNYEKNRKRDATLDLKKPSEHLDTFLIASKLKHACSLLSHENLSQVSYEYNFLNHILTYIEAPAQLHLLKLPLIGSYYFSYKTLKEEKPSFFQQLKTLLSIHNNTFTKEELKNFYSIGLNFCIKQLNQGKREYVREAFEWYKVGLKESVFLEHGILSEFHYKNIAALGLGLKEFDWVEVFLVDYKPFLDEKNRALNFSYNYAKLYFEKGDFESAMHLLRAVKYDDSLRNLTSKILLLKIYFELNENEVLGNYLNSFEQVVRRQKKLGYHKTSYLNLISVMRKLLNLNTFDKSQIQKLEDFISKIKALPERKWLVEKLQILK